MRSWRSLTISSSITCAQCTAEISVALQWELVVAAVRISAGMVSGSLQAWQQVSLAAHKGGLRHRRAPGTALTNPSSTTCGRGE